MNKKITIVFIFFILSFILSLITVPQVLAKEGKVNLLAVSTNEKEMKGSIAQLYLEIKPGSDKVFLETFPLTQIGTQISMRFAQQIACKELDIDCSKYDFFYRIRADSGIVGGPSAGAAATILTAAMLQDISINDDIAITGTINSGGIIGIVGGLKQKIEAVKKTKINKVLIPSGERYLIDKNLINLSKSSKNESDNESNKNESSKKEPDKLDLIEYGKKQGIEVIEVKTIEDALFYFTGKKEKKQYNIEKEASYTKTMKLLSEKLCNRSKNLAKKIPKYKKANKLINTSNKLYNSQDYYSAASYCFRANVELAGNLMQKKNLTNSEIKNITKKLTLEINNINKKLEKNPLNTINDLQAYMVVKQRLAESMDGLNAINKTNNTNQISFTLGYIIERLYSATSWSEFFGSESTNLDINEITLKNSCYSKINEAMERLNYLRIYIPKGLPDAEKDLMEAKKLLDEKDYAFCLLKASKSKAQANVILSIIGMTKKQINETLTLKLNITKEIIAKSTEKGTFPILGYSYYEYAKSLNQEESALSLHFIEYALELSYMDIYFPKKSFNFQPLLSTIIPYILGIISGILIMIINPRRHSLRGKKR